MKGLCGLCYGRHKMAVEKTRFAIATADKEVETEEEDDQQMDGSGEQTEPTPEETGQMDEP